MSKPVELEREAARHEYNQASIVVQKGFRKLKKR